MIVDDFAAWLARRYGLDEPEHVEPVDDAPSPAELRRRVMSRTLSNAYWDWVDAGRPRRAVQ